MSTLASLMSLEGRTALITGGAGHLGTTIAETYAELGANLILVDRDEHALERIKQKLVEHWKVSVKTTVCDLENEDQRNMLITEVTSGEERLDILVNNAAFVGTTGLAGWAVPFEQQTLDTWRRALEVNLTATFHLSQGFTSLLAKYDCGSIINIGSIYGELGPDWALYEGTTMSNPAAYGVSKAGLFQMTRWLATTISPKIRINAISPGGISRGQPPEFVNRYTSRTPLKRMAKEDDFKGVAAYLASDASSYVTGQIIRVDGGWGIW